MAIKKPKVSFKIKNRELVPYKNVVYRLPMPLLRDLRHYVDEKNSASRIMTEMLEWALNEKKTNSFFEPKKRKGIPHSNACYRVPTSLLTELGKHVDRKNSASRIVAEIMELALVDLKEKK